MCHRSFEDWSQYRAQKRLYEHMKGVHGWGYEQLKQLNLESLAGGGSPA